MPRILLPFVLLVTVAVAGCGLIYKPTIQQGNVLDKEDVAQLEPGMSKDQVLALLGPPAVTSLFEQERWDYLSTLQRRGGEIVQRTMTLWFDNGVLARIEGEFFTEDSEETLDKVEYPTMIEDEDQKQPVGPPPSSTGNPTDDPIQENSPIPPSQT